MVAPALRPLGIGEILDVSLKLTWRNLGTLVRIVLFVVAPAQVIVALVDVSAIPNFRPGTAFVETTSQGQVNTSQAWTNLAGVLVALLVGFLANEFATGACFRTIAETYLGLETSWRSSLAFAARKFRSILWIAVLGGLLEGLAAIVVVIPGIYLFVSFAVALPVLMSEGQRGSKALGRSRALVRGRWWKTAITLFVAALLVLILSGLISGLVVALSVSGANGPVELFVITAVSGTAAALVTTPFTAAYHTVLYFDLRVRKEAFDLRLLASRIGVDPPEGWVPPAAEPEPMSEKPPFWPPPPGWRPSGVATTPPIWPPPPGAAPPEPRSFEPPPPIWPPPDAARPSPNDTGGVQPSVWPPPPGSTAGEE